MPTRTGSLPPSPAVSFGGACCDSRNARTGSARRAGRCRPASTGLGRFDRLIEVAIEQLQVIRGGCECLRRDGTKPCSEGLTTNNELQASESTFPHFRYCSKLHHADRGSHEKPTERTDGIAT